MAADHNRSSDATPWWRHAVIYQVYIRSFADGNGDGCGDIAGLRQRLDHLAALGVDALWVNPWYPSPLNDGGYDVADYRDIDPRFGTLDEARTLIAEARDRGIRTLVDLVPNHTSDQHRWFQEALASPPGSPARARYMFRPGRGDDGELAPNNWQATFGGPAWTRVPDGEWYLHLFDVTQPDLDWTNGEVRAEFESVLEYWLDLGVDGFRIDVAHGLVKDPDLPDLPEITHILEPAHMANHPHWDRDGVHEIVRSWRAVLDRYDDKMMVAEAWVHPDRLKLYLRPDEYHQSFNFDFLEAPWNARALADVIRKSLAAAREVDAPSTWVLSNHDVMRHTTRYGLPEGTDWRRWPLDGPAEALDAAAGLRRARAAAFVLLSLPGAVYLYQGEELGLPEAWDLPTDVLDDPVWKRSGHRVKGRDGCRVPIPWEPHGPSLGFGSETPWLPQPDTFAPLAASTQVGDPDSTLELYRTLIGLRRELMVDDEELAMVDLGPEVLAYRRGSGVTCVANTGSDPVELPVGRVVASSVPLDGSLLPGDAAVWLREGV